MRMQEEKRSVEEGKSGKPKRKDTNASIESCKSCQVPGVGKVLPPKRAGAVEDVVTKALRCDPSGKTLVEFFSVCFPPARFRKVLKEQITDGILVAMIRVAEILAASDRGGALVTFLTGLARVRRVKTTVMFLGEADAQRLRSAVDDMIAEPGTVRSVENKLGLA